MRRSNTFEVAARDVIIFVSFVVFGFLFIARSETIEDQHQLFQNAYYSDAHSIGRRFWRGKPSFAAIKRRFAVRQRMHFAVIVSRRRMAG